MMTFFNKYFKVLVVSFFIWVTSAIVASEPYSIVFVHIGPKLPAHVEVALSQARLFNPDCSIVLLANKNALQNFIPQDTTINANYIPLESLQKTPAHIKWKKNLIIRDWNLYSERFLYLHDFMEQFQVTNVFHMEHDNMIYVNLETLLPVFLTRYEGIAATFDNDVHCVCGFIFIPNLFSMNQFAQFFADTAHIDHGDMETPVFFKKFFGTKAMDNLPIVVREYLEDHKKLRSLDGNRPYDRYVYCQNVEFFESIFDAAALGQFLVGTHREFPAGFINERCIFQANHFTYEWRLDEENRRVPYLLYKGKGYRINNLHVHSKNLAAFSSRLSGMYTLGYLDPTYR